MCLYCYVQGTPKSVAACRLLCLTLCPVYNYTCQAVPHLNFTCPQVASIMTLIALHFACVRIYQWTGISVLREEYGLLVW